MSEKGIATLAVVVAIVVVIVAVGSGIYFLVLRKPSEGGAPSFTISVSPKSLSISRGSSENLTITFQPAQVPSRLGYEVHGLPEGVQYSGAPGSFTPPSPPTTFVLTFTVADNAPTGNYSVTVICEDMDRNLTSSDNFALLITT